MFFFCVDCFYVAFLVLCPDLVYSLPKKNIYRGTVSKGGGRERGRGRGEGRGGEGEGEGGEG